MSMTVIPASEFDITKLSVSSVRKNRSGKNTAYLNYGNVRGRWGIRTPKMRLPFGAEVFEIDGNKKTAIVMSFDNANKEESGDAFSPEMCRLLNQMKAIDARLFDAAKADSVGWINKANASDSKVNSLHKNCV